VIVHPGPGRGPWMERPLAGGPTRRKLTAPAMLIEKQGEKYWCEATHTFGTLIKFEMSGNLIQAFAVQQCGRISRGYHYIIYIIYII